MMSKTRIKNLFVASTLLILVLSIIVCNSTYAEDRNGEIVDKKLIEVESKHKDRVECYRIKYLSDGLKVVGFIVKPKLENAKFPVLIYNRGGNREFSAIDEEILKYLSKLSSKNYVVLASQYRGNDGGQGREEFGGKDINDVLNLLLLAKRLPYADPDRIVMLGYSRGGMMTYLAIKEGAEIKAAAVVGGITDLIQLYDEREDMRDVLEELIGGDSKRKQIEYKNKFAKRGGNNEKAIYYYNMLIFS